MLRASTALADLKQGDKVDNMVDLQGGVHSETDIFFVHWKNYRR